MLQMVPLVLPVPAVVGDGDGALAAVAARGADGARAGAAVAVLNVGLRTEDPISAN